MIPTPVKKCAEEFNIPVAKYKMEKKRGEIYIY